MKRIAISELEGAALDWAVAELAEGSPEIEDGRVGWNYIKVSDHAVYNRFEHYSPSTDWSQCGPLIERCGIGLMGPSAMEEYWTAWAKRKGCRMMDGKTPLIAACRAIVASHNPSGYVEVPDELVEGE